MKSILTFVTVILLCSFANAQIKIGGAAGVPHPSSILELDGGTTRGLLLPRMTTAQINAIGSPANGLAAYSTTDHSVLLRANGEWTKLGFKLPFSDTLANPATTLFKVTSTGFISTAIEGNATGGIGVGVSGFSASNYGIKGTSTTGRAGYFSSTSGYALVTDEGNVGVNNLSPTEAKLVVDGKVGLSTAMFGSGTSGVVIETDPGGISFNSYNNGTRKVMVTGYTNLLRHNNTNGDFEIFQTAASTNPSGTPLFSRNVAFGRNGTLGIGGADAVSPLTFPNTLGDKINFYEAGSANIYGIGLQGSLLQIFTSNAAADVAIGTGNSAAFTERFRFTGDGKLGIANIAPTARLHVNAIGTSELAMIVNDENPTIQLQSSGVDKGVLQLAGDDIKIGTNFSNTNGRVVLRSGGIDRVFLDNAGNFSIGSTTAAAGYIFRVGGKMIAEEIRVKAEANWPDYVFGKQYQLASLENVEAFINKHQHLPNIPTAATIKEQGIAVGDMQNKLMEKVEELTLYLIKANKDIKALQEEMHTIKNKQ